MHGIVFSAQPQFRQYFQEPSEFEREWDGGGNRWKMFFCGFCYPIRSDDHSENETNSLGSSEPDAKVQNECMMSTIERVAVSLSTQ